VKAILIICANNLKDDNFPTYQQINFLKKHCASTGLDVVKICSIDKDEPKEFDHLINLISQQKEKVAVCCSALDLLDHNVSEQQGGILYEKALNDEIELQIVVEDFTINKQFSAEDKIRLHIAIVYVRKIQEVASNWNTP